MRNGKPLVWIIDGEWTDHTVEKEFFEKNGYELRITHPRDLKKDMAIYGPHAYGLIVQISFDCNRAFIEQLECCKVICVYGVGYNNIDLNATENKGIPVYNVPDYCIDEVSDHTVALIFAVARRLKSYNKKVEEGKWDALDTLPIHRFKDMTIGLLGFGRIARSVSEKIKATGARIIAHDKYVDKQVYEHFGVESVSLNEVLQQSTILSLHVPLTKETENLLDYERMQLLHKGAMIVNTCRGGVIDEFALARLIESGHISGAGIDVFEKEPLSSDHPLLNNPEVIITPHSSYVSEQSFIELKNKVCRVIFNGIKEIPQPNKVNRVFVK
ncbi:C-terminal binding protein [Siminovitchia acidinfaciens]|uniref:C-terminal binding protein n=1 Tax=Siminovitchia acidinfaciens TaxID=2321395 RepID=A0A429Y6T6_9BACI|nr:C-terminal binding protein [Siminovitchia acidinfaciens]RST77136.1 C-terminal binding protein [Siminovitchia acidinfaciens]